MGCTDCCGKVCRCCCSCLSRIPYGTSVGIVVAIVGMLMFVAGFVTALKEINNMANIKGALDFGNTVAGVVIGAGILLGILVMLFACCTSGDTRANVYSGTKSKFCGKFFVSFLMIIEYLLYLVWALLTAFMVIPVLLQITLNAVCNLTPLCIDLNKLGLGSFVNKLGNGTINPTICADELKLFCSSVKNSGTPLLISLIGTFVAALGTVHVLMCLSANFAYVNSFQKLTKRNKGDHVQMD